MKGVKEWEEISFISLQSSKSLLCKIQIFEFAYSGLSLFYSCLGLKITTASSCIYESVGKCEEISCTS